MMQKRLWGSLVVLTGSSLISACSGVAPQASRADGAAASPPNSLSGSAVETSSPGPAANCAPQQLVGTYRRTRTADDTRESDLHGSWTLAISACSYRITVDGSEQGGGRLELVDGSATGGRLALSEDLGCPNEFAGAAFYDFTLDGSTLRVEEAIAGVDPCEGRAAAFTGSPGWSQER